MDFFSSDWIFPPRIQGIYFYSHLPFDHSEELVLVEMHTLSGINCTFSHTKFVLIWFTISTPFPSSFVINLIFS